MKTFLSIFTLSAFLSIASFSTVDAQRIAVIDINAVLENLDEYKGAQEELDKVADTWRQEISREYDKIKGMYNRYQAEQVLLGEDARKQREEAIVEAETSVREMQKNRFGPEGDLFKRRAELIQPIQDKVYSAIKDYANQKGYDLIFDKGSSSGLLFNKTKLDETESFIATLKK